VARDGPRNTVDRSGKRRSPKAATPPDRPGLPAESSILSEKTFVSPKKQTYRIIKTSERDPYDEPAPPPKKTR